MEFEPLPDLEEDRKSRRKQGKNNSNLIVINEACQFCESTAKPIGCSQCCMQLCEDCVDYLNGKAICSSCREELESPKPLAKVLMFSVRATPRQLEHRD